MTVHSVTLDRDLEARLKEFCRRSGTSVSEAICQSIEAYLTSQSQASSLYDLGGDLFGADETGPAGDVSSNYRALLKERVGAKRHR